MKIHRIAVAALAISAAGLGIANLAHADGTAARKLGQVGVINQTLQPKPPKSSPGAYSNSNSATTNSGSAGNGANNANARNSADEAANARAAATGNAK